MGGGQRPTTKSPSHSILLNPVPGCRCKACGLHAGGVWSTQLVSHGCRCHFFSGLDKNHFALQNVSISHGARGQPSNSTQMRCATSPLPSPGFSGQRPRPSLARGVPSQWGPFKPNMQRINRFGPRKTRRSKGQLALGVENRLSDLQT